MVNVALGAGARRRVSAVTIWLRLQPEVRQCGCFGLVAEKFLPPCLLQKTGKGDRSVELRRNAIKIERCVSLGGMW